MRKSMCITYEVEEGLYVNVTNRCSNSCEFCIRKNGEGAYGSDSLWLMREPTVREILDSVFSRDLNKYRELVFCGYGEPSYRIYDVREVALAVKAKYPALKIRINTNGHSDLIHGEDTSALYAEAFDVVSVSLNASSADKYCDMCHPVYDKLAFDALIEFAKNVNKYVPEVLLSVVRETLSEEELEECRRIAEKCGVTLKVRTYIGPEN